VGRPERAAGGVVVNVVDLILWVLAGACWAVAALGRLWPVDRLIALGLFLVALAIIIP